PAAVGVGEDGEELHQARCQEKNGTGPGAATSGPASANPSLARSERKSPEPLEGTGCASTPSRRAGTKSVKSFLRVGSRASTAVPGGRGVCPSVAARKGST